MTRQSSTNRLFRMTRQRQVILEELRKSRSHPTAAELYLAVSRRLPHISLGTVYRNLVALAERGVILKLDLGGPPMRFDATIGRHYHIRCSSCGRVGDIPGEAVDDLERNARAHTDFQVIDHRLEFVGLCPQCRRKSIAARRRRGERGRRGVA